MNFIIDLIPLLQDNYAWLLYDEKKKNAAVIDPGEVDPVLKILERNSLTLKWILLTHHHRDHVNGAQGLRQYTAAQIIGPMKEQNQLPPLDYLIKGGERLSLDSMTVEILETPGHTRGSICYYFPEMKAVFVGDTLFSLGCGRLFEGTAEQMFHSLQRLTYLPDDTQIYCGHEYTQSNGNFALTLYPNNLALKKRMQSVEMLRKQGLPTIPVSLELEKQSNPFLIVKNAAEFATLRARKDRF